jgi:hypothetical protein
MNGGYPRISFEDGKNPTASLVLLKRRINVLATLARYGLALCAEEVSGMTNRAALAVATLIVVTCPVAYSQNQNNQNQNGNSSGVQHVLLISIDGFHAVDFINCSQGIPGFNGGAPYCPNLTSLAQHGINYLDATTSKPSDSFPGLTAIISGGSPRSYGAFYDVAYDRALDPPAKTTGNGVTGAPNLCTPGATPTGTTTEYEEGINIDQTLVNGGAPNAGLTEGGVASIDSTRLPRDPANHCNPVFPWNFVRTNTIFGVIHAAGGYTAWSDKHPAYSSVSGPGPGMAANLDDFYAPEINSNVIPLNITTLTGQNCNSIDSLQTGAWTDSFQNIRCYDSLKVNAILNQIKGLTHNGSGAKVPTIFGMNFQAVSVGQKLIEYNDSTKTIVATGGYADAIGTPTQPLLEEIQFVDTAIGAFASQLKHQGLEQSTLVIITAKHGQSPIDPQRFFPIPGPSGTSGMSPASILCALVPASGSPTCAATGITDANIQIGPTEDDVSLLWLKDSSASNVANAVSMLQSQSPTTNNIAGIGQIFSGPAIAQMFNSADSRTPDIIVTPNVGVVYTGSKRKLAEHGGFAHDDTNVITLLSNPGFKASTITSTVQTAQIAPTILQALGLNPNKLQAVQQEGTPVLPGLPFGSQNQNQQ